MFLKNQLPGLKAQLDEAQQNDTDLHKKSGIVDLSEEARQAIVRMDEIKNQLLALQQKRREVAARFVSNDMPEVRSVNDQIHALEEQQKVYAAQMAKFPDMQQDIARSEMQVKVDSALYTTLLNNAQQLELVKAGKVGTVRMIDVPSMPEDPVFPKKAPFTVLGALFGLLVGLGVAFVRNTIWRGINNPHDIERTLGMSVYATVPFSKQQQVMLKTTRKAGSAVGLLAEASTADPAVESLRGLRMALNHGLQNIANNIVLMTGATPGVGKSFISANFARVLAKSGKRVLLIDADLRNGHLHRQLNCGAENGLADLLDGSLSFADILQHGVTSNLDFISAGSLPSEPGELLLSPRLNSMLMDCARLYDIVLIDSPPVLAVSDAAVLAQHAGTIFLVALSDVTKMAELEECSKHMHRSGANITGVIFNGSDPNVGDYSYGYSYGAKHTN
jgi:tyrosine-protein kinase Etk/Wzc